MGYLRYLIVILQLIVFIIQELRLLAESSHKNDSTSQERRVMRLHTITL